MTDRRADDLLLAAHAGLLPAQRPDADTARRLREQLLARVVGATAGGAPDARDLPAPTAAANPLTQRLDEGEWYELLPGIRIKSLRRDATSETTLWRVAPGAVVPPHAHRHEEECLILEGSLIHAGVEYFPGDYVFAAAGERHAAFTSPNGALFLIRGEPVPDPARLARLASPR